MKTAYIAPSVNGEAVNRYLDAMKAAGNEIHTMQIYQDNQLKVRLAADPYDCTDVREVYSLSKTFASSVVGIASDLGYLSVEDRVLDYFPEIKTDNAYYKAMKIKHLLSMNSGHEECVLSRMFLREVAYEGFFEQEPKYEPGSRFVYNTGATAMIGPIIERATGQKFFDFACEKLFYPMGIHNIRWRSNHDGSCICGAGLQISSDDIVKLGLLYLNKGVYNGKRILSEEWIEEASSPISDNYAPGDNPNWNSGYGYQIWRNEKDGYRGDGACGQFCLILPRYRAVVAIQAYVVDGASEIEKMFDLLDEIDAGTAPLKAYDFAPLETGLPVEPVDMMYKLEENKAGFVSLHMTMDQETLHLHFANGNSIQTISAGHGKWLTSRFTAKYMVPILWELMTPEFTENIVTEGSFRVEEERILLSLRHRCNPHTEEYMIYMEGDRIHIHVETGFRAEDNKDYYGTKR